MSDTISNIDLIIEVLGELTESSTREPPLCVKLNRLTCREGWEVGSVCRP